MQGVLDTFSRRVRTWVREWGREPITNLTLAAQNWRRVPMRPTLYTKRGTPMATPAPQTSQTTSEPKSKLDELSEGMKTPEFWNGFKEQIQRQESMPSKAFPANPK